MNCMNCGYALTGGVKFCPRCGTPAPQPNPYAQQQYTPPPTGGQMHGSFGAGAQQYGAPPPPRRKSRLGKFLLIAFGVLLIIGIGAGTAVYFGYRYLENTLKNSEPYRVAVEELKRSPAVAEHLGEIKDTGFPLGSFNENAGGTGSATFTMSVEGTKSDGQYVVTMSREGGAWTINSAYLRLPDGRVINLADKPEPPHGPVGPVGPNANTLPRNRAVGSNAPISAGVLNGKAIEKPEPAYPAIAKAARASGTVTVQVTVDEQGRVVEARAVGGHPLLQQSAVVAARQARFTPTLLSGKPVKVTGVLTYDFKLE